MRILYHHRIASLDGQFVHIDELVRALRRRGHEVRVVGPRTVQRQRFGGEWWLLVALRRRMPKAVYELLELAYGLGATLRLLGVARRFEPDLIYERYNLHLPAGILVRRLAGVPLILEVNAPLAAERAAHGGLGLPRLAKAVERWTWRGADRIVTVTGVLAEMIEAAGVERPRIRVVANAVDLDAFRAIDRASAKRALAVEDRCVLGFVGFVRPWHGLDRAIHFLAAARRADLLLLIVGDGPARPALEALAKELGVGQQVRFLGTVARSHIPNVIAAFDIALQPAVVPYASPLKLFEYMAAGCAILAPDSPNIREIVRDGIDALLFAEDAFAQQLARLVEDDSLRARLGAAARERIYGLGRSWDANAAAVEALAYELGVEATTESRSPSSPASLSSQR
jgi:glycosyltransferase involved in cell wall biosynthesis